MTDSLFEDSGSPDPEKNYLTELVGEGKKFKTVEDMAYGKAQSDSYIKILERQLDHLKLDYETVKTEVSARARLEDLVKQMNSNPTQPQVINEPKLPEIDKKDIKTMVVEYFQEAEVQKQHKENLDMVKAKLAERFGNNSQEHIKQLGISDEAATMLAKTSPHVLLKALGVDKPPEGTFSAPPRNTSLNTPNKAQQQRTWAYYQELFKTNPQLKLDRATNVQMQKDYIAQGPAFEDGDFNRFGQF